MPACHLPRELSGVCGLGQGKMLESRSGEGASGDHRPAQAHERWAIPAVQQYALAKHPVRAHTTLAPHCVRCSAGKCDGVHIASDLPVRFVRRFLLRQTCWLKKDDKNLTRFYTKLNPGVIFSILGTLGSQIKNQILRYMNRKKSDFFVFSYLSSGRAAKALCVFIYHPIPFRGFFHLSCIIFKALLCFSSPLCDHFF